MRHRMKLCVTIAALLAFAVTAHAADAPNEGGFFSDAWRQVTDTVTPSSSGDSTPRHATEQNITIKNGAVGVDDATVATKVTIESDDTILLQSGDGSSVAPAMEQAEPITQASPRKKADASVAKESSVWDDMVNSMGLGDDASAAKK